MCFSTILGIFWKIDFLKEIWQAQTFKNSENLELS